MEDADRAIIAWLKRCPASAVIQWVDDHLIKEKPWCGSWIDVRVPDCDLNLNWIWTVIGPDDWEEEDSDLEDAAWQFIVEHDLDLHAVYDPEPPNYWYVEEFAVPKGATLSAAQEAALEKALHDGPNRSRSIRGGWSPDAISASLREWAKAYAGRDDLVFRWSPDLGPSEMVKKAEEILERIESGQEEGYDIGDGVRVSDEAMDLMLRLDPDEAAGLMDAFKRSLGRTD